MDQIHDKAPFLFMELDSEESTLPVVNEEMKSGSLDFSVHTDAEFSARAPAEENCLSMSSDRSDLAREASVHAEIKEVSLSSNIRMNEPTKETSGSTQLLTDVWDNLTYDGSVVSFECDQESWKLENFDDEQFDCLMSQYVPTVVNNGTSTGALHAEVRDDEITDGSNSVCLSSVETGLNETLGVNSGGNTSSIGEHGVARTSGDKNICTAQQPSTLTHTESNLICVNNTRETSLLCYERCQSGDSTGSGSDVTQSKKREHYGNKVDGSKDMANTTQTDLLCDEQFESSDSTGSGLDVVQNAESMHYNNTISDEENQSKNMTNDSTVCCDVIRIISGSRVPPLDKNDAILSCESRQDKTLEPVLSCTLNKDSGCKNADAFPVSELTSSGMVCKPGPDVRKESSQIALTIDDIGSFIEIARAAASGEPQPICSNPSDSMVKGKDLPNTEIAKSEEHETSSDKNCEPSLTEFSSHEELLHSDDSNEEVLLLEYANQEETGVEGCSGIVPSEKIKKSLSDKTSKDEDVLQSANRTECPDQALPCADVVRSLIDGSKVALLGGTIVHGQLPTDNSNSQMEDPLISLDITSSITDQTHKGTSDVVEMTGMAHQDKDLLQRDTNDSFNVVHQKNAGGLTASEHEGADESTSIVQKSISSDECGLSDLNNTVTPKRGHAEHLIVVDEREDSPPPTDCDIDSVVKHMKKEKPWSFDDKGSAGEYSWKDPVSHGLKECFCPHGIVSIQAGHFHCQECGFSSVYKTSIMRHEVVKHRVKHTLIKIIQCRLCPSVFVRSRDFRQHSQKHAKSIVADCQGEEQKSSDSEIPQQDYSITPSSESPSPSRRNSASRSRCRRSSIGWNWKVAFDFKTQMEQRAKKRKSDQMTSEKDSAVVEEKPVESFKFKLKRSIKDISESEKKTEMSYYNTTELSADGVKTTVLRPCYDGVLLASLTEPTNSCPICYKKFSKVIVQKHHYAQVHKTYLQGISLFQCTPCGVRTVSSWDFEIHMQTERHRTVFSKLTVSDLAVTSPVASCAASSLADECTDVTNGPKGSARKRRSSSCVVTDKRRLSKKSRRSNSGGKRSPRRVDTNWQILKRTKTGRFKKREPEIVKDISTEKIRWFYGSMKRNSPSPEIHQNACVLNHVCTSACVCEMAAQDKIPSKKNRKKKMIPDEKYSESIQSESPSTSFQPVILDSFSCLPSMWTSISDITSDDNRSDADKSSRNLQFEEKSIKTEPELPSQFASNTTKAIKFFQNTRRTVFTASLQNTVKPQEAVPQTKPRCQVALKSTSQQTYQRLKNSAEEKVSQPEKTNSKQDGRFLRKYTIIQVSDDEDHSLDGSPSYSATVALDSGSCKTRVGVLRSESTAGCSDQVLNKTVNGDDFDSADVRQLDDLSIRSRSKNRRSVSTASTSRSVDVMPTESSLLSDFHSDALCNELQKRGFMKRCTCGVFFLGLPTYDLHCAWHSSGAPLRCSFCKADTKDWYEFYSHIQNHCK